MEIIPTGNTSLNELTEKYVRKQYGEEAVSELEANITTVEKEAAGQAIDGAIMADKLHPYVKPPDGVEQRLTKDGWDLPLPGENYDDNVWRTFATGELNHGENDDLRDLTVYFRNEEASNFLNPISSDTSTQLEPGPLPQREPNLEESVNSFKRNGAVWDITFQRQALETVKNTDGMHYIAILLERATACQNDSFRHESKVDSVELYEFCKADGGGVSSQTDQSFLDEGGRLSGAAKSHPQQEIVTPEIIKETEKKIRVLKERIEEFKTLSDTSENIKKIDDYEDKIKELEDYLKKTIRPDPKHPGKRIPVNFTGPSRSASEKIHHALKKAYKNIERESPDLATHLRESIASEDNKFQYRPLNGIIPDWWVPLK